MRDFKSRALGGLALSLSLSLSSEIWKHQEECLAEVEQRTNHLRRLLTRLEDMRRDHAREEKTELWDMSFGKKKESASGQFACSSSLLNEEPKHRRNRDARYLMKAIEAVQEERKEHLASLKHMWLLQGQSSSSYPLRSYHPSFEPTDKIAYPPREARRREELRASVVVPVVSQPSPPPPPPPPPPPSPSPPPLSVSLFLLTKHYCEGWTLGGFVYMPWTHCVSCSSLCHAAKERTRRS